MLPAGSPPEDQFAAGDRPAPRRGSPHCAAVLNQAAAVLRIPNRAPGLINLFARFFKQVAEFFHIVLGGGEQLAHLLRLFIDSDCLKADRKRVEQRRDRCRPGDQHVILALKSAQKGRCGRR